MLQNMTLHIIFSAAPINYHSQSPTVISLPIVVYLGPCKCIEYITVHFSDTEIGEIHCICTGITFYLFIVTFVSGI